MRNFWKRSMAELRLEDVSYRYGADTPFAVTALSHVNLTLGENRTIGIIGHTGSGKSTLAQLLNGILRPTEGRVLLDGKDIFAEPKKIGAVRFRVGLVFQYPEYQLFEETVRKDISFGPGNMGKSEEEIRALVAEAARFTGLDEKLMERSPFELSGGQKRRVAIAGVIAMDPDILVLDEPAAGLDPAGKEEILSRLKTYQQKKQKTLVLISHSMEDMAVWADEIVVMKDGTVFCHDTVDGVFDDEIRVEEAGLEAPQITRLMRILAARGVRVDPGIHTVKEAAACLSSLIKGGEKPC